MSIQEIIELVDRAKRALEVAERGKASGYPLATHYLAKAAEHVRYVEERSWLRPWQRGLFNKNGQCAGCSRTADRSAIIEYSCGCSARDRTRHDRIAARDAVRRGVP